MTYKFAQIDPRPQGADANEKIFAEAPGGVLGIEVTIPELAQQCQFGNLDHHGPDDTAETPSACEQALAASFPADGATLATVRPDADSVTAMAVLASRAADHDAGCPVCGTPDTEEGGDGIWRCTTCGELRLGVDYDLVQAIGRMDRYGPAAENRDDRVVAIARVSADFKRSLAERVAWVRGLLAGHSEQADEVADLVAVRDADFAAAEAASEVSLAANGRIAVVESSHRFATNLGYERASVVVAFNPEMPVDFRDPSKGTYRKFTVCRYDSHTPCDLPAALAELQSMEDDWGGRGDIFGSPQGTSSKLSLDEVIKVVSSHLK